MNTLTIDTHKTILRLKAKGYSQEQAEGLVETLTETELVTKGLLETVLKTELMELEGRLYRAMLIQTGSIAAIVIGIMTMVVA